MARLVREMQRTRKYEGDGSIQTHTDIQKHTQTHTDTHTETHTDTCTDENTAHELVLQVKVRGKAVGSVGSVSSSDVEEGGGGRSLTAVLLPSTAPCGQSAAGAQVEVLAEVVKVAHGSAGGREGLTGGGRSSSCGDDRMV